MSVIHFLWSSFTHNTTMENSKTHTHKSHRNNWQSLWQVCLLVFHACLVCIFAPLIIIKNKKTKQNQLEDKVVTLWVVCGVLLKKVGMIEKESFPMKSHLADIVHCKAATFSPLSNQGLRTFSPTELPYPPQASVFEARQLKCRLMESPRVFAMRAQTEVLAWILASEPACREAPLSVTHLLDCWDSRFAHTTSLTYLSVVLFSSSGGNALNRVPMDVFYFPSLSLSLFGLF